ncbi:MAG TPA: adenylate kinase [Verrucomicrobiales bacterium]|nr:adenylate kinase [Verrucomicrobiales bacterium]
MAFASHSFVFLGPPASGKGTQGRRLSDEKGSAYLSTGALLRGALRDDTDLGRLARPYLDRGEYVPDDIMLPGVLDWVKYQTGGWVLDGFPRTVPQAEALDAALEKIGLPLPKAMILHVPDDELRRRITCRLECESCHRVAKDGEGDSCPKCGGPLAPRADDASGAFESRLAEFHRLVVPTIQYYTDRMRGRIINGTGSPDEVWVRIS